MNSVPDGTRRSRLSRFDINKTVSNATTKGTENVSYIRVDVNPLYRI